MKTKATSWYAARGSGGQGIVIEEGTGRNVAVTYEEKDAPLAAAAPEMAELLTKVLQSLDDEGSVDVTEISAIRALLAKIRGEQNV